MRMETGIWNDMWERFEGFDEAYDASDVFCGSLMEMNRGFCIAMALDSFCWIPLQGFCKKRTFNTVDLLS